MKTPLGIKVIKRNRDYRVKLNYYFIKEDYSQEGFYRIDKQRKPLNHMITDRAAEELVELGHAVYIYNRFEIDL